MNALSASEGYRLWAPTYGGAETAISYLEQQLVRDMTPPLDGLATPEHSATFFPAHVHLDHE